MPDWEQNWVWLAGAAWYVAVNLAALVVFAWDKRAAVRGARRVRERTLLGLVWLGGFAGGLAAMRWARHKTRRWVFRLTPWTAAAVHATAWVLALRAWT